MDVRTLIERLQALPPSAPVQMLVDGGLGYDVDLVYQSKGGPIVVASFGAAVYDDEDTPQDFPPRAEGQLMHWLPEHD